MSIADRIRQRATASAMAAGGIAIAGIVIAGTASSVPSLAALARQASAPHATAYNFRTLDNAQDLTFNQLLGINDYGLIAGYFGGAIDALIMRIADVQLTFPAILIALLVTASSNRCSVTGSTR